MTTNIGDGLSVGNFLGYGATAAGSGSETTGKGVVLVHKIVAFDGTPAISVDNAYVAAATVSGAATVRAGTGVTAKVDSAGTTRYSPDYPRNILITGATNVTSVTFTVKGYDRDGVSLTEDITGPTGAAATSGLKAFASVVSVKTSATTTANVKVGFGDVLGLAIRIDSGNYMVGAYFDGAADTGTLVVADTTSPATATTGDTRGTFDPTGTLNGTKRVTVYQALTPAQVAAVGQHPTLVYGVTQFS